MDGRAFSSDSDTFTAFKLLDSPNIDDVKAFIEHLKGYEKEVWVVENLISYYLQTESLTAADLIVTSHSSHDKVIFKKLHTAFEDAVTRTVSLKLLLHIVSKNPPWLHKIVEERIFMDMIRCMKNDRNASLLMESIYIITMLLPVVPDGIIRFFDAIFDSLMRLISLTFYNKEHIEEMYILHLNVGIYSLFSRLYGMYPWHFINSLQDFHSKNKTQHQLYVQAIEPMLFSMKLNPSLVTVTREKEDRKDRWMKKAAHDIVAECASLSLDSTESTQDFVLKCPVLLVKDNDKLLQVAMQAKGLPDPIEKTETKLPDHVSAPVGLAKDSLVSMVVNSSTFFSPSDRLDLSTPPPNDPSTPGFNTQQSQFTFTTSSTSTPQPSVVSIKTPQNSSHNTPSHYTPTPNPLEESSSHIMRSRHTSGNKGSASRVSLEEMIPESPLRKEFTSEPPTDVQRVLSEPVPAHRGPSDRVSINNLHQVLEKISDTTSAHGSLPTNNSDDEEVSAINQRTEIHTSKSVAEFMKTVNRIRFNSINVATETERSVRTTTHRPISWPPFTEEHVESSTTWQLPERSASIQTKSSIDLAAAVASKGDSSSSSQSEVTQALPAEPVMSTVVARGGDAAMASQGDSSAAPSAHPHGQQAAVLYEGPSAKLDEQLCLSDQIKLAAGLYIQQAGQQASPSPHKSSDSSSGEASVIKGQLALLHTQLLYERQKRELHAQRNRRLLSKIAKAEKYRDENVILRDKLKKKETDVFNLQTTHRLQTSEIQRVREETTRSDSRREEELASLIRENERLKYSKEELQRELDTQREKYKRTQQKMCEYLGQVETLEQHLSVANEKINTFTGYEEEVSKMKRELLFMGEVQVRYEEKLSGIKYDGARTLTDDQEHAFVKQIDDMREAARKQKELMRLKQQQLDLMSNKLRDKDVMIKEHQKVLEQIRGENQCLLEAVEDKYQMSLRAEHALEMQIMSLYDQIGRLTTPLPKHTAGAVAIEED